MPTVNVLYCTHDRGHGEKQYIRIRGRNIKFVRVSGCTLQETDMSINQTNWKTLTEKLLKFTARTSFITEDCPYPFGSLCRVNITYGYTLSSAKCIPLNLCFHKYGLYHGCITKSWEDEWDTEYEDKMEGLCGRYYHVESSDECPTTDSDDSDSDRNHYWRTPEEKKQHWAESDCSSPDSADSDECQRFWKTKYKQYQIGFYDKRYYNFLPVVQKYGFNFTGNRKHYEKARRLLLHPCCIHNLINKLSVINNHLVHNALFHLPIHDPLRTQQRYFNGF